MFRWLWQMLRRLLRRRRKPRIGKPLMRDGRRVGTYDTGIEVKTRKLLSKMRIRYEAQRHFKGVGYVDFYLPAYELAIECDGEYWHSKPGRPQADSRRDARLWVFYEVRTLRLPGKLCNGPEEQLRRAILRGIRR